MMPHRIPRPFTPPMLHDKEKNIVVRQAGLCDLSLLSETAAAINRQHFPAILGTEAVEEIIREYLSPEGFRQWMEEGIVFHLVLVDEEAAGYCAHKLEDDCFMIEKFYLKEQYRGLGLGSRMMEHMLAYREGRNIIRLTVNQGSKTAQHVYAHMGFQQVDTILSENGPAWTLYLLEKNLEEE